MVELRSPRRSSTTELAPKLAACVDSKPSREATAVRGDAAVGPISEAGEGPEQERQRPACREQLGERRRGDAGGAHLARRQYQVPGVEPR